MPVSTTGRIENFFIEINKSVRQIFITIGDTFLAIPVFLFNVLGNPGPFISIIEVLLLGWAWIWLGDFLLKHIKILRVILNILNVVAITVSELFGVFGDSVEVAFNILAKVANIGGGIINDIGSIFGDKHIVPKIPTIPLTKFPILDFDGFIKSLDSFNDATATCAPFNNVGYEFVFPLRYALNDQVCPIVRYMTNTIVYDPLAFLLSIFYFDADPREPGGGCQESEAQYICFFLKFGYVLIYIFAPFMTVYWLLPVIKKILLSLLKLAEDTIALVVDFCVDLLHTAFHKSEGPKKKN